jgi:imidazolonepropionase
MPFAGWRIPEYRLKLQGASYQEISRNQGGIEQSRRQFTQASDGDILSFTQHLLREAQDWGTTAIEMKSGYGLNVNQELRALQLIRSLQISEIMRIVPTGLFLHALDPSMTADAWTTEVTGRLLPEAVRRGLIESVDVFIETMAFTPAQAEPVLAQARALNLPIRLHTNQFSQMGGLELAARMGARAVDHAEILDGQDINLLKQSHMATVLLPLASYYEPSHPLAPARTLIAEGIPVALATDFNSGTAPVLNLPTVIAIAVQQLHMTPEEALTAVTVNAAWVLGIFSERGSLTPGKSADIVVLEEEDIAVIPYRLGHNPVDIVVTGGQIVKNRMNVK